VDVRLFPEVFDCDDLGAERRWLGRRVVRETQGFRAHTDHDLITGRGGIGFEVVFEKLGHQPPIADGHVEQVDRRFADEFRHEGVSWFVVTLGGRPVLLQATVVEDGYLITHGHRFGLIVGHVHRRHAEILLKLLEIRPHLGAKFRVEITERFVHQESLGLPDDRTPECNALLLPARKVLGVSIEQLPDFHHRRRFGDPGLDFIVVEVGGVSQPEAHVLPDGHVGIERIRLEHHRKTPLFGRSVGHDVTAEQYLPLGDGFEAGNTAQRRRFPTAARTNKDDELTVVDRQIQPVDCNDGVTPIGEVLGEIPDGNARHEGSLRLTTLNGFCSSGER